MKRNKNAVVPHDEEEDSDSDDQISEQLVVRDDNVYANISDDEDSDDEDSDDDDEDSVDDDE